MATRVAVFLDYQNVYKRARECFCGSTTNHVDGQVDPLKVGGALKGLKDPTRSLKTVRVYRGMPSEPKDQKGYAAALRQVSIWGKSPYVVPRTRPLNYRDPHAPREKGIDVLLAVDLVLMAARNEFDVAVVFSGDTDLVPALEAVIEMKGDQAIEAACWVPPPFAGVPTQVLSVKGHAVQRRGLANNDYLLVHDPVDYTQRTRRR